jgi:hypothetical protein
MMIIGVDYHPSFQQIAFLIEETGEFEERPTLLPTLLEISENAVCQMG